MYAVVSSGGKQYRVEAGSTLTLERLDGEPGASFIFDRVLLIGDGDEVTIGTPVVAGASVSATVLGEALGPKLVIFKFKQKVKYRRRTGHRQHLTRVRIDAINPDGRAAEAPKVKREARARAAKVEVAAATVAEAPEAAAPVAKPGKRATAATTKRAATATPKRAAAEKPKAPRASRAKAAAEE